MPTADVLILGGGVMGLSIAYNLAARAAGQIIVLERKAIASGATGRSSGIVRQHYSHELLALMALRSLDIFKRFGEIVGGDAGFVQTGYVILVPDKDKEALRKNVEMHQRLGIQSIYLEGDELGNVDRRVRTEDAAAGAYEPESGYADPTAVARAYAARAQQLGVQIRQGVTATAARVREDRVIGVETSHGVFEAGVVVNACGAWANSVVCPMSERLPITPVRAQICVFQSGTDEGVTHPVVGDLMTKVYFRWERGGLTLAGSIDPREFLDVVDPDRFNEGVDAATVEFFAEAALRRFTFMDRAVARKGWSGLYDVTPDGQPIIGRSPLIQNYYLAVGFSGHGFKHSPVIGIVVADLVTSGQSSYLDISALGPRRFTEDRPVRGLHSYRSLAIHL